MKITDIDNYTDNDFMTQNQLLNDSEQYQDSSEISPNVTYWNGEQNIAQPKFSLVID